MLKGVLLAALVLMCGLPAAAQSALQEQIARERAELRQQIEGIARAYAGFAAPGAQFGAAGLRATFGAHAVIPPQYEAQLGANAAALQETLRALEDGRPMTLEAIRRFRRALAESEVREAAMLGTTLWNLSVARMRRASGGPPQRDGYQFSRYDYDGEGRLTGGQPYFLPYEAAVLEAEALAAARVAPMRVEFRLGVVSIDSAAALDDRAEAEAALVPLREAAAAAARAVARHEAALAEAEAAFAAEAEPLRARMEAAIRAAGDDRAAIARERTLAAAAFRSLAATSDIRREALAAARAELSDHDATLRAAETRLAEGHAAGLPTLEEITTPHAQLLASADRQSDLARLDEAIAAFEAAAREREAMRERTLVLFGQAADRANQRALDLQGATVLSYQLQANLQALVQVFDAATASRGHPHVFAGLLFVQGVSNLIAPPEYYDNDRRADAKTPAQLDTDRATISAALNDSVTTATAGYLVGPAARAMVERLQGAEAGIAAEAAFAARTRAALGRRLAGGVARIGTLRAQSHVGAVVEALMLTAITESLKQALANAVTDGSVMALAQEQLALHVAALMLRENALLEDADAEALTRLRAARADLLARLGRRLPGRAISRPALEYRRNDPFLPEAETWITFRFDGPAPEATLFVNGIEAEASPEPGQFRLGAGLIAELARGSVPDLDLDLVLR